MRKKRYERSFAVFFLVFIIFVGLLIIFIYSFNKKIKTYEVIDASVVKENLVEVLVTDKQLNNIYRNEYLFIDKRKRKIKIENINKSILKRNNKSYHSILINLKFDKSYKTNDIVKLLFFKRKINIFSMIKIVWKGV